MACLVKETEFVVKFSYKENCKPNDLLENSTNFYGRNMNSTQTPKNH